MTDLTNGQLKWIDLLKTFGLPTVLLFGLLIGIYKTGVWTADNVALPLVSQQVQFMRTLAASDVTRNELAIQIKDNTLSTNRLVIENTATLIKLHERQTLILDTIQKEHQLTREMIKSFAEGGGEK